MADRLLHLRIAGGFWFRVRSSCNSEDGLKIMSDVVSKLALEEVGLYFFWAGIAIDDAGCTASIGCTHAAGNRSVAGYSNTRIIDEVD